MGFKVVIDKAALRRHLRELELDQEKKLERVLRRVGELTVRHLQGYTEGRTGEYRPAEKELIGRIREKAEAKYAGGLASSDPDERKRARERVERRIRKAISSINAKRRARAKRPLHPGGWADVTRDLRNHYSFDVKRTGNGWLLSITNDSKHAYLVEMRDGLFVVRGISNPGGPMKRALREAVREIAPEWDVK